MINLSSLNKGLVGHWRLGTDFQKVDANVIPSQADSTFESWTGNWYVAEGGSGSTVAKDGATDTMLMTIGGSPATFLYAQLSNAAVGTIQANSTVIFTADVYIPSATVIDACYLYRSGFTGVTTISSEAADLSLRDQWQTLRMVLHFDTDVTGTIVCAVNVSGGSSGTLKWDNVTVKQALIADLTPYGNHCSNYGVTFTTDRKGQADMAGLFAGAEWLDAGLATQASPTETMSVVCWFNTSTGSTARLVDKGKYFMTMVANKMRFGVLIGASEKSISGATTVSDGEWRLAIGVYDGSDVYIYIDDVQDGNFGGATGSIDDSSAIDLIFGRRESATDHYYSGSNEEIRIYNRALSSAERTSLYNQYNANLKVS